MPIIAVGFAVAAVATAVSVGTTLAIVAAVGAVIGAIGSVTGVKELAIAGGIIGAVGAIGGLASSAGLFGAGGAEGLFSSQNAIAGTEGFISGAEFAGGGAGAFGGEAALGAEMLQGGPSFLGGTESLGAAALEGASTGLTDIIDMASGTVEPISATADVLPQTMQAPDVLPDAATNAPSQVDPFDDVVDENFLSGQQAPDAQVTSAPQAPKAPQIEVTGKVATPQADGAPVTGKPTDVMPGPNEISVTDPDPIGTLINKNMPKDEGASDSVFSNLWNFAKKNPTLTGAIIQAGGAFIGGAFDSEKPAKIDAWKAQADANAARAALDRQNTSMIAMQQNNMSQPLPVARRTGLINRGAPA